jgi:copper chaperone
METAILDIKGMSCQGCVASVKRVLSALPGVQSVDVTLEPGKASVAYDPARVSEEQLRAAVENAGYDVAG